MSNHCSYGLSCRLLGCILCFCYLCAVSSAHSASAQSVSGTVRSVEGDLLQGVHVSIPSLERGVITNIDGIYKVENLAAGEYTLLFSYIGFQTKSESVLIASQDVSLNVVLVPEVLRSEEELIVEGKAKTMVLGGCPTFAERNSVAPTRHVV